MKTKLSTRLTLACLTFFSPLLATAQQTQRSTGPGDWPGPWHMWNGGWGFWWVFPLIMVFDRYLRADRARALYSKVI